MTGNSYIFQLAMANAPVGMALSTPDGRLLEANPALCRILGYSLQELLARDFPSFTHPDDVEKCAQLTRRVLLGEIDAFETEKRFLHKNGQTVWTQINLALVTEGSDNRYFIAQIQDISARKAAEAALRDGEERYRSLVEGSPDIVYSFSSLHGGIFYSPRAAAVLGYTLDYLYAHPRLWNESIHPDDRARIHQAISEFARGVNFNIEYRIKNRQGHWLWFHDRSIQRRVHGDEVIIDGLATDITERKRMEDELTEHKLHLEQLLEEKTRDLRIAKQAAEAANVAKSLFLANMSHELRTPMNIMLGHAQLLEMDLVDSEHREQVQAILKSGQHLLALINDVLDLSKIEAGKLSSTETDIDIAEIANNVVTMVSERVQAKGLRLNVENQPLPCAVVGDPTQLQQGLLNYVTNAVKFSDTGSITLRIRPVRQTRRGVLVRFEVTDTGIGIAPETMSKLFTAFEQADNTATRKHGGTGLGLAITKKLAELMGGEAGVNSTTGAGSTFWFTADLKKSDVQGNRQAGSESENAKDVLARNYRGRRVLLAEDDGDSRKLVKLILENVGLEVDMAIDGAQAIQLAQAGAYDLILMDMQMPNINGVEATRRIRQLAEYAHLPIIAITANAFADDQALCLQAGMNQFLTKPIELDSVYKTLLQWLQPTTN